MTITGIQVDEVLFVDRYEYNIYLSIKKERSRGPQVWLLGLVITRL